MFLDWGKKRSLERQASLAQMRPVILMGRGHSGTRVLSWICAKLNLNLGTSDELATGDADDQRFTDEIKKIATRNVGCVKAEQCHERDLRLFQKAVAAYHQRHNLPQHFWGWKFPETYLIGPYVHLTFPQAQYIHLVRDGRDLAFKRHLTDDPKRKLGKKVLSLNQALELPHHLQAAISWAWQVDQFEEFLRQVLPERVFTVTFEEMCKEPQKVAHALSQFLQVPMTPACEEYLKKEVNASKVAQYRENDPTLVAEVEQRIRPTLLRYHYLT